jgi:hypothetical protein
MLRLSLAILVSLAAIQPGRADDALPGDVTSIQGLIAATYAAISGPAGPRDWARFGSLFRPDGRLISVSAAGVPNPMEVTAYQARVTPSFMKNPFFEKGISEHVQQFGHIAHVFSVYESRRDPADAKPFARGINSFQLMNDGHRWWIESLMWQAENPQDQIPPQFLKQ